MEYEQIKLDGWLNLFRPTGPNVGVPRRQKYTDEATFDIILNCKTTKQVQTFAQKYGMSEIHVRNIKNGHSCKKHWQQLREEGKI